MEEGENPYHKVSWEMGEKLETGDIDGRQYILVKGMFGNMV